MANDHKNDKDEKKKLKNLAKEEKKKEKLLEKEEKRRSKEELKMKKKEEKRLSKQGANSTTDVQRELKTDNEEIKKTKSETQSTRSNKVGEEKPFQFMESRFVMPRGRKGYVFPVTPGPARYPVTRINYPIMKARRQVDLTKKMIVGQGAPAFTMGIKHSEIREFYNKIQ